MKMFLNWNVFRIITIFVTAITFSLSDSRSTTTETINSRQSTESNAIQRGLKRVFLSNRTITCCDGSQSGFYLRKSSSSKRWVVFLEGGWHCYDQKSCRARWLRLRHLMTSAQWPETRNVGGILSSTPSENPYWHDANHVFVPYCSSDSWSGTKSKPETRDGWRFMGSLIVRQVIADLIPLGLGHMQGAELLLAGSSAGGLGVMLNVDKIKKFLHEEKGKSLGFRVKVRGVSDSGWFLDREPYVPNAIAASEVVRQGWKLWHASLPEACTAVHSNEPWRCYFGHHLYPTMKSPLFVFQWLFDEAQMRADSVGALWSATPQQWNYIHEMGGALRASLDNVTAVFAPSCIGHSVLTKRDWLDIKIDDISLAEALRCWERSTRNSNKQIMRRTVDTENQQNGKKKKKKNGRRRKLLEEERKRKLQEKQEREEKKKKGQNKKNGNRTTQTTPVSRLERSSKPTETKTNNNNNHNNVNKTKQNLPLSDNNLQQNKRRRNSTRHQQNRNININNINKKLDNNNNNNNNNTNTNLKRNSGNQNRHKLYSEPKKCSLRLLERCSWPQCNHSCPTLTNPLTGEEMRFLELLASFGLDIEAVATALGVDMQTLNNMDHTELVNLLTQQVS